MSRQSRAQERGDARLGGATNYQAIQEAKKGGGQGGKPKQPPSQETKNLDSSFVVYEVEMDGILKFVKIL